MKAIPVIALAAILFFNNCKKEESNKSYSQYSISCKVKSTGKAGIQLFQNSGLKDSLSIDSPGIVFLFKTVNGNDLIEGKLYSAKDYKGDLELSINESNSTMAKFTFSPDSNNTTHTFQYKIPN